MSIFGGEVHRAAITLEPLGREEREARQEEKLCAVFATLRLCVNKVISWGVTTSSSGGTFQARRRTKNPPPGLGGGKSEIRNLLQQSLDFLFDVVLIAGFEAEMEVHHLAITVDQK